LVAEGYDLDKILSKVSDIVHVEPFEVWAAGKEPKRVEARRLMCYWAVKDLGISMAEPQKRAHSPSRCKSGTAGNLQSSRRLKLSLSGVSLSVKKHKITTTNLSSLREKLEN
jgi:hypothetical protein